MLLLVVLLLFVAPCLARIEGPAVQATQCWSSGNNLPAKFWEEGARIDRGKFWYECHNGELVPKGCFSEGGERLFIGQSYVANGYEVTCALDERGDASYTFTGCSPDGIKRYKVGDTWDDERKIYWFTCAQDGPYVKIQIGGCLVHDKSRRIALGERYDLGDYTYECMRKHNNAIQMCSVGCIHKGQHYNVGQQWPDGEFLYYCKLNGGRCQKVCVGCQYRNKRLYDGDRYTKDATVYQCEVRTDKFGHKPVGCVVREDGNTTFERVIGCRWYTTTPNAKLEQTCVLENEKAIIKTLGCVYVHKGYDTLVLNPNTYTIWTAQLDKRSVAVACRDGGPGTEPSLEEFSVEKVGKRTQGLTYEQPQG